MRARIAFATKTRIETTRYTSRVLYIYFHFPSLSLSLRLFLIRQKDAVEAQVNRRGAREMCYFFE